jgi:hypothetical protein
MSNITPFVKRMRTVGGTIYVFSSATEDIGLNISERNNVVKMSNYALLNIPDIAAPTNIDENKFNVLAIPGAFNSFENGNIKDGGVILAESFQNYALNLEANLINRSEYDSKLPTTVSERVFWKWLKETGAIRWDRSDKTGYWKEELFNSSYTSVVQNIGEITAGSIRYDGYGSYNETYVLIPSSYGKSHVYFKQVEDVNYAHGIAIQNGNANILGRENYTIPHPDALDYKAYYDLTSSETTLGGYALTCDGSAGWWTTKEGIAFAPNSYVTDKNTYLTDASIALNNTLKYYDGTPLNTIEFKRSKVDCMSLEYNLTKLYGDASAYTFDDIAMKPLSIGENYDFNTILVYYSVYASSTATSPISTNLLGVLFLDNAVGNTSALKISPSIVISSTKKIQGGNSIYGSTGFGTSYSFRLNIKTDNMFDDTQSVIYDNSSATTSLEETQNLISALEQSVNILNKQTSTINYISNQYVGIASDQNNILNSIVDLQYSVNGISRNITGSESTIPMFSSGINPLVDSSIFVYNNNIGIKTNRPTYDLQVNGDAGVNNLLVSQSIKNSNGDILLGVGSYLNKAPFVQEASLGISFYWSAGKLLVSGADVSVASINALLAIHDSSIGSLTQNKVSKTYVDGSLGKYFKDTSLGVGFILNTFTNKYDVSIATLNTNTFITYSDASVALALKADLGGNPIFTGSPQRSTSVLTSDNSNIFATTNFVHSLVDVSLNGKADKAYVDASLNLKASLSYIDASLNLKTDLSYVDASLNLKANVADVSTNLNLKSNITYVDSSLALRDISINNLSIKLNDLSTNYYSPYIPTNTIIIPTNSSTYTVLGNIIDDRSIILNYTVYRNSTYREGEIRILNTGGSLYLRDSYQENNITPNSNAAGLTFNAVYVDSSININIVANSSDGSSTTFKYNRKIIRS